MACASAVFFFNLKGDLLMYRIYRDEVDVRVITDAFRTQMLKQLLGGSLSTPVKQIGSWNFLTLRSNDVVMLAITQQNVNAMMTMNWMASLVELLKGYFGKFKEKTVRNNFVLVFELLDEAADHGYPQITEASSLKGYIFQKATFFFDDSKEKSKQQVDPSLTLQVTGKPSYRKADIVYKKNELFLDVVERIMLLQSADGSALRSEVLGKIMMNAKLSGMPEVRLGLNEFMEDVKFEKWVNLSRYEQEKQVTFVPPDGQFELCSYRVTSNIHLPFTVQCVTKELGRTKMQVNLRMKATYTDKLFAVKMKVLVPVPPETAKADIATTTGGAKYDPKQRALVWKIKRFIGGKEHQLAADVTLVSTTNERKPWSRPPVSMEFTIPMYDASNVRVTFLRVWEKSSYKVDKWVRKICQAGDYQIRMPHAEGLAALTPPPAS